MNTVALGLTPMQQVQLPGEAAVLKSFRLCTQQALSVWEQLKVTKTFESLKGQVDISIIQSYCMRTIWDHLRPIALGEKSVAIKDPDLYVLLRRYWNIPNVKLRPCKVHIALSYPLEYRLRYWGAHSRRQWIPVMHTPKAQKDVRCRIAVECAEGVDDARRSDLFWWHSSGIEPNRLWLYLLGGCPALKPIARTKAQIQALGLNWVSQTWKLQSPQQRWVWQPTAKQAFISQWWRSTRTLQTRWAQPAERWLHRWVRDLLDEADFWDRCFEANHIGLLFSINPTGTRMSAAQCIALTRRGGLFVGCQRSLVSTQQDTHGKRLQHVLFCWGQADYALDPTSVNTSKTVVCSGYPFHHTVSQPEDAAKAVRQQLAQAGTKFVVALLDNAMGNLHSRAKVVRFYRTFLQWLLKDPEIGLVIKPKKPSEFASLSEIQPLLQAAQKTGRCWVVPDSAGRLPSEAADAADMSVGFSISTAVIEAALKGHRGIHWDTIGLYTHPFYSLGYQRFIFDDLDALLAALQRYHRNPASEASLGVHGNVLASLDPFGDGRAGKRIGHYMRYLLEAFDQGKRAQQAVDFANASYARQWGSGWVHTWPGKEQS